MKTVWPLEGVRVLEWGGLPAAIAGRVLADLGAEVRVVAPKSVGLPRHPDNSHRPTPAPFEAPLRAWLSADKTHIELALEQSSGQFAQLLPGLFSGVQLLITSPAKYFGPLQDKAVMSVYKNGGTPPWIRLQSFPVTSDLMKPARETLFARLPRLPHLGSAENLFLGVYAAAIGLLALCSGVRPCQMYTIDPGRLRSELLEFIAPAGDDDSYWDRGFCLLPAKDGWVSTTILGDWTALAHGAAATGAPSWLTESRFEDLACRYRYAEQIFEALARWSSAWKANQLTRWAQLRRIPTATVRAPTNVVHDPQLRTRKFFRSPPNSSAYASKKALCRPRAPVIFASGSNHPLTASGETVGSRRSPEPSASTVEGTLLRNVRVLDFTHALAGPLTSFLLRHFGAQVTKIDPPGSPPTLVHRDLFSRLHEGKKRVAITITSSSDNRELQDLIRNCDVLIDNFSVRVMNNWGLKYTKLRSINPGLVQIRMTGFGLTGPLRHWVAYAPTLHAWSGHTWLLGLRHGERPVEGWPIPFVDILSGLFGFLAGLAALWFRKQTGSGLLVDLSEFECAVFALTPALLPALKPEL